MENTLRIFNDLSEKYPLYKEKPFLRQPKTQNVETAHLIQQSN